MSNLATSSIEVNINNKKYSMDDGLEFVIWGSDKDKYDALTVMLLTITKGILNINHDYEEICKSILE